MSTAALAAQCQALDAKLANALRLVEPNAMAGQRGGDEGVEVAIAVDIAQVDAETDLGAQGLAAVGDASQLVKGYRHTLRWCLA